MSGRERRTRDQSRESVLNEGRETEAGVVRASRNSQHEIGEFVILVVDDEMPIAEALAMLLEDDGFRPIVASNGRRALEAARERWPDLVVTDYMMPQMDGLMLASALRELAATEGHRMPPIILMTAAAVGAQQPEALGVDWVVRKPFDVVTIETAVRELLGRSSSR